MSSSKFLRQVTMTIPNGSTESNVISSRALQGLWMGVIYAPSSIGTAGTVTLYVNPDPDATAAGSGWCALQQNGADVTMPAVNKAFAIPELSAVGAIKLVAAADPGAAISYKLTQSVT